MATNKTLVENLEAQIASLKKLDPAVMQARASLFTARLSLEDTADELALAADLDRDVVLLVTRTAWLARLDATLDNEVPDADTFADVVRGDVVCVLNTLARGETETGHKVTDKALAKAIELSKHGAKIIPVRELMDQTKCLIGQ